MIDALRTFPMLRRAWWLLGLIHLTALVDFAVYLAQRGGRPSRSLLAFGVGLLVIAVVVSVVAALLTEARLERARRWLRPIRGALAPLCLLGLFSFGLGMRAQLIYAHAALALALTAALALVTLIPADAPLPRPRLWLAALIAAAVVAGFFRLYALSVDPTVNLIDEPWDLSWIVSDLRTGQTSEFNVVGQPGDPTYYTTAYIPRWAVLQAQWMKLVGIGLWQGRLLNLLLALVALAATARAAHNLYGGRAGLFTAAALFTSALFVLASRLRHDVGLGLALALSLWLYSEALKRGRGWFHLLAGIVMGWGGFSHYHVAGLAPAVFVALYLPRYLARWRAGRRMPERGAWLYALGLTLGVASFVAVQILPDVSSFLVNRAPRNPESALQYLRDAVGFIGLIPSVAWIQLLLIALGLIAALWRRRVVDWTLTLLFVLAHLALALVTDLVTIHYLVPLLPIYGLLVGTFLSETFTARRWTNSAVAVVAGFCLLMPAFGQTLRTPIHYTVSRGPIITPPLPAAQWVRDHVAPRKAVLAESLYYLWLTDYAFISPFAMDHFYNGRAERDYGSRANFWMSLQPDVIIFDPNISTYGLFQVMLDDPAYLPARGYQRVAEIPGKSAPILIYARSDTARR